MAAAPQRGKTPMVNPAKQMKLVVPAVPVPDSMDPAVARAKATLTDFEGAVVDGTAAAAHPWCTGIRNRFVPKVAISIQERTPPVVWVDTERLQAVAKAGSAAAVVAAVSAAVAAGAGSRREGAAAAAPTAKGFYSMP